MAPYFEIADGLHNSITVSTYGTSVVIAVNELDVHLTDNQAAILADVIATISSNL